MNIILVTNELGYTDNAAIGYLSSVARSLLHKTFYCSLDRCDFDKVILEVRPDVIGYTADSFGIDCVVNENRRVSKFHKFVSIIGGAHPTFVPKSFSSSSVDAYCIGEGEEAFREFLIRVERNESFDDVSNLITRNRVNSVRPLVSNLDNLPMPDRDLIFRSTFLGKAAKKTFFTSRGCPFSCSYCCNSNYNELYRGLGKRVRKFSVDRVLFEIKDVRSKYRMDFVKFDDDCFAITKDGWLDEFTDKYPRLIGLPFNCVLRID